MIKKYVLREKERKLSKDVLREVLRYPILTEKSTAGKERGEYFFVVAPWASKVSIARAVESLFDVKVKSVNTLNRKGKRCRFKGKEGVRSGLKKAMISLKDGSVLDLEFGGGKVQ